MTKQTIYKHIILFLIAGITASIVAYFRDAVFSNEPITLFVIMMFYIFGVVHGQEIETPMNKLQKQNAIMRAALERLADRNNYNTVYERCERGDGDPTESEVFLAPGWTTKPYEFAAGILLEVDKE